MKIPDTDGITVVPRSELDITLVPRSELDTNLKRKL